MIWAGRWGGADPCKIGALGSIPSRSTKSMRLSSKGRAARCQRANRGSNPLDRTTVSWSSAHGERLGLISPGERQISATAGFDPLDDYQIAGSSGWPPWFIPTGTTVRFRPPLPTLPV